MDIKTFNCKVGLVTATTGGGVKHRGVAITSPRTGRTIKVWDVDVRTRSGSGAGPRGAGRVPWASIRQLHGG